jgi:hypothetical protein
MSDQNKILRLLITTGPDEEILAVLVRKPCYNPQGEPVPPSTVEHKGVTYAVKRKFMEYVYVYVPSKRKAIDDFLGL